jgi:hypothetical protein
MFHKSEVSILPAYRIRAGHIASIFEWWILIHRIVLWLAMPSYYSSLGYQSLDCFFISACSATSLLEQ